MQASGYDSAQAESTHGVLHFRLRLVISYA